MTKAPTLESVRSDIARRMDQLRPAVDEVRKLLAAREALQRVLGGSKQEPERPQPKVRSNGKVGRPKGSGQRPQEVLRLVRAHPGLTIPEIAENLGMRPNYLYRVLPALEKAGHVKHQYKGTGKGWVPVR